MKQGKAFEQLVVAIQEYTKNTPNTLVVPNAKLTDICGIEREIDILVTIPTVKGEQTIAFECRDHKRKVGVFDIDSFISKYHDLPMINKIVVASNSDFTIGAQRKAQYHGIVTHILGNPMDGLFAAPEVCRLQCMVGMPIHCQVIMEGDNNPAHYTNDKVFYSSNNKEVDKAKYTNNIFTKVPFIISAIHDYMQKQNIKSGFIPWPITPPEQLYMVDIYGNKQIVKKLQIVFPVYSMKTRPVDIAKQSLYTDTLGEMPNVQVSEYKCNDGVSMVLFQGNGDLCSVRLKDEDGGLKDAIVIPQTRQ